MSKIKLRPPKPTLSIPRPKKSLTEPASSSENMVSLDDAKNIWRDIKEGWSYLQKQRFKKVKIAKGQYKSDRWIWNGAMLIIFFWLWFIAQSYDYNLDYFKCGEGERLYEGPHQVCKNPFYKSQNAWKSMAELPYGEYGQKPGPLFNSAWYVTLITLTLAGILNHVWHNRRQRR